MATLFVSAAGSNTSPYDTEAKAANAFGTAVTAATAADTIKVINTHNEALTTPSYTFPTTPGLSVLSVAFDGSGTGALTAGATITNNTNATQFSLVSGYAYFNGLSFVANNGVSISNLLNIGSSTTADIGFIFDACTFNAAGSSVSARTNIGPGANVIVNFLRFYNCTFTNGAIKSIVLRNGDIEIDNMTLAGTAPTSVFVLNTSTYKSNFEVRNSDLSNLAWTNLFDTGTATAPSRLRAINCKLVASFVTVNGAFTGPGTAIFEIIDCHSGDVNYFYKRESYEGTISIDNAVYYDATNGTTSYSMKMESSANASFAYPLVSPPISFFNETLSAMTTTVECVNDGTTYTDAELWQETAAKITSGSPIATTNRGDRVANILTTPANQTSSSVSWTGTGGFGAEVKQKLVSTSFTPAEIGNIVTRVYLAKASDNVYISPLILASSDSQYATVTGLFLNEHANPAAAGGGSFTFVS